jgi:hypothetical protein
MASTTSAKKKAQVEKIKAVWSEIQSHEKSALFAASSHNPDLQMSLDAVKQKMDNHLYDKRPRDFVQDMNAVFTVDANSSLASAASSFKILIQCLLEKHDVNLGRQASSKRHRRGTKRPKQPEVFDFVAEFEEELSSGFLFEGEQFLSSGDNSPDIDLFGENSPDDDSSAEDFVPLSFSFEQESVLDGRSPALYSELLESYGWSEWEPASDDPASPKTDSIDDESSSGDSSNPGSPLSSNNSTTVSPSSSSKRGKRQRSASLLGQPMRWSKEELLFKITNELASDKLEGIILIVNPALEFGDADDEDLEFDINALDENTLFRLQEYVHACLEDGEEQGDESMMEGRGGEIITITQTIEETVTTSPRKKTRTKAASRNSRKTATTTTKTPAKTSQAPVQSSPAAKKSTRSTQRRKNASPAKTKSPAATTKKATTTKTTQVIETTICHFVEQDDDFNYIPHSRGARLNTLVPEAFEVFRTEQVIKVQKSASDSDMEEEVDII